MNCKLKIIFCFAIAFSASSLWSHSTFADEFQISLNSGSVFTVESSGQSIQWIDVLANGDMKQREIPLEEIKQLVLTQSPASSQIAEVRQYLTMLASDDYHQRETAEEQLSDSKIGGRFVTLIKSGLEHPKMEVRYRVKRILDRLNLNDVEVVSEFDRLTLNDGTKFEGDAGEFRLTCKFRGQTMTLNRQNVGMIVAASANSNSVAPVAPESPTVSVRVFHSHKNEFYNPDQTTIDFETSSSGGELGRNTDVSELFINQGVKLSTQKKGYIGISGYGFKIPRLPPKDNSICVFETIGNYPKRFKGVMELNFCMPNQPSVDAGVHEIGLFIARVTHSRDFIMECYNADGQILGAVEASDQEYVFTGIKSSEPITHVRIFSNPYLFRLSRKIDEDFAVDHLCFSPPVPVSPIKDVELASIRLKNGDLLKGDSIKLNNDSVSIEVEATRKQMEVSLNDTAAIRFETKPIERQPSKREWAIMLDDRSVLHVQPGSKLTSSLFDGLKFDPANVMAFWFANNQIRFPFATDFEQGKRVMVFPTCRIATGELDFNNKGFQWIDGVKIRQDVNLTPENDDGEDPTPDITEIDFADTSNEEIPTAWMKPPKSKPTGLGLLRLIDGQQLTLGGSTGFSISNINNTSITVNIGDLQQSIPLSQVLSVDFPAK